MISVFSGAVVLPGIEGAWPTTSLTATLRFPPALSHRAQKELGNPRKALCQEGHSDKVLVINSVSVPDESPGTKRHRAQTFSLPEDSNSKVASIDA